jgi:hypothetical protein
VQEIQTYFLLSFDQTADERRKLLSLAFHFINSIGYSGRKYGQCVNVVGLTLGKH